MTESSPPVNAHSPAHGGRKAMSLPEELQMSLPPIDSRLRSGSMDLVVAAIIELASLGRTATSPSRFGQPSDAKLTVVDASPTGSGPLDALLAELVAHGKPWKIRSCVSRMWSVVAEATTRSLVERDAIRAHGTIRDRDGYLEPLDGALRDSLVGRLAAAPSSDDPRAAILLDIRHHSAWGWDAQPGQSKPPVLANYPDNVELTARAALSALYIASGTAM